MSRHGNAARVHLHHTLHSRDAFCAAEYRSMMLQFASEGSNLRHFTLALRQPGVA